MAIVVYEGYMSSGMTLHDMPVVYKLFVKRKELLDRITINSQIKGRHISEFKQSFWSEYRHKDIPECDIYYNGRRLGEDNDCRKE